MNNAISSSATLKAAGITKGLCIERQRCCRVMEESHATKAGRSSCYTRADEGSPGFAPDVAGPSPAHETWHRTRGRAAQSPTHRAPASTARRSIPPLTCNLNTTSLGRRIQMWIDHHGAVSQRLQALPAAQGEIGATLRRRSTCAERPQGRCISICPRTWGRRHQRGRSPRS